MTGKEQTETSQSRLKLQIRKGQGFAFGLTAVHSLIHEIRGVQVILDRDLARLYEVEAKQLNRQVQRNRERFPEDFMFQLSRDETASLKCQTGTSSWGGDRYLPYAFTEQGVAMLSGVLRSEKAIQANILIMRAFVAMRGFMMSSAGVLQRIGAIEVRQLETDKRMDIVFDALGRGNMLPSGMFPAESEFDALRYVTRLVESARSSIVLIDPYSDAVTLDVLAKKRPGVKVRLVCKNRGKPTPTEIAKFNRQHKNLTVDFSDTFHDRFLVIDDIELHNLGSSVNCLGRRVTTYTTRDRKEIAKVLSSI